MRAALIPLILAAVFTTSAGAQPPPPDPPEVVRTSPRGPMGRRMPEGRSPLARLQARDDVTTPPTGLSFRLAMMRDLELHVPLLHEKLQAFGAIQDERQKLQIQKRQVAQTSGRSEVRLKRFHDLLRREDLLTSRQRALYAETARDAERIRNQIAKRRSRIEAHLRDLELRGEELRPTDPGPDHPEFRFLTRALRVYETLEQKLDARAENRNRPDWVRPLFRGLIPPEDEPAGIRNDHAERRLKHLRAERDELRRRLMQVQREIDELERARRHNPPHDEFR